MLVEREILNFLIDYFSIGLNRGIILSGIVGCGKTTVVKEFIRKNIEGRWQFFEFSGDDTIFRSAVLSDSKYIYNYIKSKTTGPCFIFVDEVQKTEECFDAIKYAFDHHQLSFIISGSNPDYLNTNAKKRLQRRADFFTMHPFSLSEILLHKKLIEANWPKLFKHILFEESKINLQNYKWTLTKEIENETSLYLSFGGLPRAYLSKKSSDKLFEIRQVVERGFESLSKDNSNVSDLIIIELANLHAKEFTYQGIFQKSGLRRREVINTTIDQLINHGYLTKKKPIFITEHRNSYFNNYSWIDPGIVSYLTGEYNNLDAGLGHRIEGMVAARLKYYQCIHPLKSEIGYFKPYTVDKNDKVKFLPGEIDFIFKCGKRIVPIEVKSTSEISNIKTDMLENFIINNRLPFGFIIYGGVPYWNKQKKILFWPYWSL